LHLRLHSSDATTGGSNRAQDSAFWFGCLSDRWIKQHLRIKVFFGTSENAVKTQI
jgi:hypothetical protein